MASRWLGRDSVTSLGRSSMQTEPLLGEGTGKEPLERSSIATQSTRDTKSTRRSTSRRRSQAQKQTKEDCDRRRLQLFVLPEMILVIIYICTDAVFTAVTVVKMQKSV